MIRADLHVHTTFCDGKNTPEEVVLTAIEMGLSKLGFSGHSHTFFDESYCMSLEGTAQYKAEIKRLKEKYADKIEILCGVEQDLYSEMPTDEYDYVIGSVHYLKIGENYYPIDESADDLRQIADEFYGGDFYSLCEDYFKSVSTLGRVSPDIIGHLDLVAKFNRGSCLFDEQHPRYIAAAKAAIDALLPLGVPFEVNTGAIARSLRDEPYPARPLLEYILENGGKLILSGDTHLAKNLCYDFERWENLINK